MENGHEMQEIESYGSDKAGCSSRLPSCHEELEIFVHLDLTMYTHSCPSQKASHFPLKGKPNGKGPGDLVAPEPMGGAGFTTKSGLSLSDPYSRARKKEKKK